MNDDDRFSNAIDEIERGLLHDDPAFVARINALRRSEIGTAITVFVLLASGAVLMTVGFATLSWLAWAAGLLAFLTSFVVDGHHKHVFREPPPHAN
jgi:hypothetical protein